MEELLRQAAFGDDPGAGRLLRGKAGSGRERLLAGILAGAEGRYATAATLFQQLMRGGDRVLAAHAAAGFAAHRRQLGGHGAALRFDGLAVAWATTDLGKCGPRGSGGLGADELDADGLDAEGALVDGLLGLAADNLGLGRLRAARLLRAKAGRLLAAGEASSGERVGGERRLPAEARSRGWRGRIRAGWIGAEIELAAGNAQAALPPAEQAAELARACGAVRHGIKSDLVLAAALTAAGDSAGRERALDLVRNARLAAEKYELRSLIWPAALISADLVPANGHLHRSRADTVLHAVLLRADPGGRRLARESPWVPV
ncbi:hypothetical protein [Amycolatopsis sp. 195334CR]|uniref:hypothetical protein n=1 Tax=Amycolatopsis sp. 195334CR TaxID=2814588 RepID=UPI001A907CDF|nr:hypothetical protein [Amycolatopsis sp. 195334CR]MBN6036422.1 hypothetical protein [Amycolatopsis sp. 195334CR]